MGDNLGFLLPAWLLLAPLVLAIGDLMKTSSLPATGEAERTPASRPVVSHPHQEPASPTGSVVVAAHPERGPVSSPERMRPSSN